MMTKCFSPIKLSKGLNP